jgi:hypothetical protein
MLHVTPYRGDFKTMVAIPVNKVIPENNNFLYRRMVPGKILVTEVTGGTYTMVILYLVLLFEAS